MRVYKALLAQFQAFGVSLGLSAPPGICLTYLLSVGLQKPVCLCCFPSFHLPLHQEPFSVADPTHRLEGAQEPYAGLRKKGFGWQPLTLGHMGCPTGEKTGLQLCASPVGGRGVSIHG